MTDCCTKSERKERHRVRTRLSKTNRKTKTKQIMRKNELSDESLVSCSSFYFLLHCFPVSNRNQCTYSHFVDVCVFQADHWKWEAKQLKWASFVWASLRWSASLWLLLLLLLLLFIIVSISPLIRLFHKINVLKEKETYAKIDVW